MSLFFSRKKHSMLGVDFLPTGIAVAQVVKSPGAVAMLRHSEFLPSQGRQAQAGALREWVSRHGLRRAACYCLLRDTDYDINLVERPEVDESELAQAMTWRIRDLVSYDVASAVVDIYPMPVSAKNNRQQVSVVSADESVVGDYVDTIGAAGLRLEVIDVHDLVSANLPVVRQGQERSQAILSLGEEGGMLNLFHDTDLYVSRRFKIGISRLASANAEDPAAYDDLLLEIQRSMDYYESYYGNGSVPSLRVFPRLPVTEKMALYLQNLVAYDVDFIEMDGDPPDFHCFHAYCAALRGVAA